MNSIGIKIRDGKKRKIILKLHFTKHFFFLYLILLHFDALKIVFNNSRSIW